MPHPNGYRDMTLVFESKAGVVEDENIKMTITI